MYPRLYSAGMAVCGPPCSLHVSASQSVHMRSWSKLWGNIENMRVRCSNRIWLNFATRIFMFVGRMVWNHMATITIMIYSHHIPAPRVHLPTLNKRYVWLSLCFFCVGRLSHCSTTSSAAFLMLRASFCLFCTSAWAKWTGIGWGKWEEVAKVRLEEDALG